MKNNPDKIIHFKNLDGLRAVAAFAVVFYHISLWIKYPDTKFYDIFKFVLAFGGRSGPLGVTFFFILSGFLITYLMFREQAEHGKLNVPFFYIRRLLRIWPLYYLTLIAGFLIYPFFVKLSGQAYAENASPLLYSIFAVNFDNMVNGPPGTGILGVQWSVAIEEQFYLIWPIAFYLFSKKNYFPFLLLSIILISELFFVKASRWEIGYYHLISNFRFLSFGGLLAYFCYFKREMVASFLNKISKKLHFAIYFVCLLMILFMQKLFVTFPFYRYIYHILPFLFFGFVIVEQNFSNNSFFKIGSFKLLNWLGKISYGLYLTHMIAIYIVLSVFPESTSYPFFKILSAVLLTVGISHFSFTYIELRFLSIKSKFSVIKMVGSDIFSKR